MSCGECKFRPYRLSVQRVAIEAELVAEYAATLVPEGGYHTMPARLLARLDEALEAYRHQCERHGLVSSGRRRAT